MKTNKFHVNILSYGIILLLFVAGVSAGADQQPAFRSKFSNDNTVLLGTALKKFLTMRVVTVSLYIAQGYVSSEILDDIPKRIEVNYHVRIPKRSLGRATIDGIRRNYNREQLKALMPQINQINSYYPNVKPGDQIVITYTPGFGSLVQVNGKAKGVVAGADFAKAFFSIWIGENPVDKKAKLKLLGKEHGES
jgi:hypothetical protein